LHAAVHECLIPKLYVLPKLQARTLVLHLFSGVAAIHERGVLHGDISMSNILFNSQRMILIDMSEACVYDSKKAGLPVTCKPNAQPYDDVYALGLVLYTVLTLQTKTEKVDPAWDTPSKQEKWRQGLIKLEDIPYVPDLRFELIADTKLRKVIKKIFTSKISAQQVVKLLT
jgi:serine/threonine protein kinase